MCRFGSDVSNESIGEPYIEPFPDDFETAHMAEFAKTRIIISMSKVRRKRSHKLIVLADRKLNNHLRPTWSDNTDTPPSFDYIQRGGKSNGYRWSMDVNTYRDLQVRISDEGPQLI
jgi:hypothetical protein